MRYGVLEYKNPNCINIGDSMQIISVLNLYQKFGIEESDIIRVNFYDLQTYNGEEVVLPICFPFYGYNSKNKVTCFSPKIYPIFLSLSLFDTNIDKEDIEYLRKYEPIGCRDEYTAEGLAKKGVETYLNGCMTLTLETKKDNMKANDVICVDLPEDFYKYMPENLRENIKKRTHIFKSVDDKTDVFAKKLLKEYASTAKIAITSRLHMALPCYAVGIPVIFIHSEYSYRFSWIEDMIHIYLPDEWNQIDWKGSSIKDNAHALYMKELMIEIAKQRIIYRNIPSKLIYELQQLYDLRNRHEYSRGPYDISVKYINTFWKKNVVTEYAIWGISQVASALIDYIRDNFPMAKLVAVIDASKTESFKNHMPVKLKEVKEKMKDLFVFITADAVNAYAIDFFDEIGKNPSTYFMCWKHIKCGGVIYQEFNLENGGVNQEFNYRYKAKMMELEEIKEDKIIYLDHHDLKIFSGEYVILPIIVHMVNYYGNGFADCFSDRIISVFIGVTIIKEVLSDKEISYLKRFESIGSRDERIHLHPMIQESKIA